MNGAVAVALVRVVGTFTQPEISGAQIGQILVLQYFCLQARNQCAHQMHIGLGPVLFAVKKA